MIERWSLFLTNNSKESIKYLQDKGYIICPCCTFKDTLWLHFYYRTINVKIPVKEFHGVGYSCENECENTTPEKCLVCALKGCSNREIRVFYTAEDIDNFISNKL